MNADGDHHGPGQTHPVLQVNLQDAAMATVMSPSWMGDALSSGSFIQQRPRRPVPDTSDPCDPEG